MELEDHTVVRLDIDAGTRLTKALIAEVENACNRAEDARPRALVVVRLIRRKDADRDDGSDIDTALLNQWERSLRRLERLTALTVGVAEGGCGSIGLAVLLVTDYRLATADLRLSLLGPGREILPGMALYRLANELGAARARRLALFGAEIGATDALAIGLIDDIVDDPIAAIAAFEDRAQRLDFADLAVRRQLLLEASARSYENALGTHLAACDRALRKQQRAAPGDRKAGRDSADPVRRALPTGLLRQAG